MTLDEILREAESKTVGTEHRSGLLLSYDWEQLIRLAYQAGKRDLLEEQQDVNKWPAWKKAGFNVK